MTEKEKMLSGALYNAGDLELVWERDRAKALWTHGRKYCGKFGLLVRLRV